MGKWIVGAVLVAALGTGAYYYSDGFASRVDVAKAKIGSKIDKLLGETEIQKTEVERAIKKMDQAVDELMKGRISAEEQAKRLSVQATDTGKKVTDAESSLRTLKEYVSTKAPVDIAGKTYTQAQVEDMATKVLTVHKSLTSQLETLKKSQERMQQVANTLQAREDAAKQKMVVLKNQLKEIDTELVAIKHMQAAARIASDTDDTLGAKFEELEKKVNDLHVKVRTEVRFEDAKWQSMEVKKDEVDSIISATKGQTDVLSEIDKVLNKQ